MSVFPGNVARPDPFSNLNFGTSQVIPNLTVVGLAPNGTINLYNHLGNLASSPTPSATTPPGDAAASDVQR